MMLIGQQLGYYRLVHLIGQGGMGEVYLAEDTRMPRQVAVKIVRNERQPYPDAQALQQAERLFQREMQAIAQLDHPHILSFHDFGEEPTADGSVIYMVMPYCPEGSLANWLVQRGSELLALQDVGQMIVQAASALQHAHDHNVIHQDVKPSNFFVRANAGHPTCPDLLLADFRIARVMSVTSTTSNIVRGTYTYMAPEQWSGKVVAATDQYALAIMTYQLLTGHLPFQGRPEQIMFQHLNVSPKMPSQINASLSLAVDAVILRALAKQANERFPTVKAFAVALQQAFDYVDLRATLSITREEALQGTSRTITLPSKQQMTVMIPPNAQHEQALCLPDQGMPYYSGGPCGCLQLTLSTAQTDSMPRLGNADKQDVSTVVASNRLVGQIPPTVATSEQLSPASGTNVSQPRAGGEPVSIISVVGGPPSLESGATPPGNVVLGPPPGTIQPPYQIASTPQPSGSVWLASLTNNSSKTSKQRTIAIIAIIALVLLLVISSVLATMFVDDTIVTNNAHAIAQTATAQVQATATTIAANSDPYSPAGTLALLDPLSQSKAWSKGSNAKFGGKCQFVNGAYQISQSRTDKFYYCDNKSKQYSNFTFEVKMTINRGDCGGLVIRNDNTGRDYIFEVSQEGFYFFLKYKSNSSGATALMSGISSAIKQGTGQSNTIAVVANGGNFDLYVNGQKIDHASDSDDYSQGYVGLVASAINNATTVTYQDARLWML